MRPNLAESCRDFYSGRGLSTDSYGQTSRIIALSNLGLSMRQDAAYLTDVCDI